MESFEKEEKRTRLIIWLDGNSREEECENSLKREFRRAFELEKKILEVSMKILI